MSGRAARHRVAWSSLVVATALVVAGCSGGGDGASAPSTTAPSSPAPAISASTSGSATPGPTTSPTTGPTTGDTASVPGQSTTAAAEQILASRDFTVKGTYTPVRLRMRFSVVELKRRGDLLDVKATLTNLEKDGSRDLRWQVAQRFEGPFRRDITHDADAFSGVVLTDLAGKKRYLVAADSGGACVCTDQLSSTFVGAGQSVELDATFAAPPAATTKLDVAVTSIGTIRDLPVS